MTSRPHKQEKETQSEPMSALPLLLRLRRTSRTSGSSSYVDIAGSTVKRPRASARLLRIGGDMQF